MVLESTEDAERILGRTCSLREDRYRILRDLNQEDSLRMREAVGELKRRNRLGDPQFFNGQSLSKNTLENSFLGSSLTTNLRVI